MSNPTNNPIARFWQNHANLIAATHDTIMAALSFVLALWVRLGEATYSLPQDWVLLACVFFTLISLSVFLKMRLYKGIWRYASLLDLLAIVRAVTVAVLIFLPILFLFTRLEWYPRSTLVINWLLLILMLGAPRMLYRLLKDGTMSLDWKQLKDRRVPVLMVGAGDDAELYLRNCRRYGKVPFRVVGFLDDDPQKVGRNMHGIRVVGLVSEFEKVVRKLEKKDRRPHKVILTGEGIDGAQIQAICDQAEAMGLSVARLPKWSAEQARSNHLPTLAPIAIEDLLGRPQSTLDIPAMQALLTGKRIMITGAGGSIGSELSRQVAGFEPAMLILADHSEYNLYAIDQTLSVAAPDVERHATIIDIGRETEVHALVAKYKPEIIFHAAALKHVPLSEEQPLAFMRTNILGTRFVADAAREHGVEAMVCISTDKAVHPTNIMGATKRAAESYCQALDSENSGTRFVTVRFGNVLGSTGSVVPLFRKQLEQGGPLTVTHPDMERFFMTVREAVALVIQASALGLQHEDTRGGILVLEMGRPMKILELAKRMIRLSGLEPDEDVQIEFTGLRAGEKLYEELFYADEERVTLSREDVMLAQCKTETTKYWHKQHKLLTNILVKQDEPAALEWIKQAVPTYSPA